MAATALSTVTGSIERWGMQREQLDLLKRTIAKGTSDDEFALFMNTSTRLGLDPFAKQIYAVMRFDKREERKVMAIQVSIDGFRAIADKTGECDGQDGPYWCGEDGVWRDVWLHEREPAAAKVTVFRKGQARGYTGIATYASYVQTDQAGDPNSFWRRLPDVMLAKAAESIALRKAFPAQLAGVYTPDEMGQADSSSASTQQPDEPQLELDADDMSDLLVKIEQSKSLSDLHILTPTLSKLIVDQKDVARSAWRAKAVRENWIDDKSSKRTSQDDRRGRIR